MKFGKDKMMTYSKCYGTFNWQLLLLFTVAVVVIVVELNLM